MLKHSVAVSLILVALLHAIPSVGVLGVDQLERLYGIRFEDSRVILLMQHRALLFGLLSAFLFAAVWFHPLRPSAIAVGLVSTGSFCLLAVRLELGRADGAAELLRVFQLDVAAVIVLLIGGILQWIVQTNSTAANSNPV